MDINYKKAELAARALVEIASEYASDAWFVAATLADEAEALEKGGSAPEWLTEQVATAKEAEAKTRQEFLAAIKAVLNASG